MEIASQLIFLLSVCLCALIVGVVSWMVSKEKSYEEALEETKKSKSSPSSGSKKKAAQSTSSSHKSNGSGKSSSGSKVSAPKKKEEVVCTSQAVNASSVAPSETTETKKKLVIVEEEIIVPEEAPAALKEEPSTANKAPKKAKKSPSSNKDKKKATKASDNGSPPMVSVREILSLVERTAMDEGECQHLIDVLLNKQVGESGGVSSSWVQNPWSSSSSMKKLQKDLADRDTRLEESQSRVKSLSDKLVQLRTELNAATILSKNSSRILEEMQNKHEKEKSALVASHTHQMETRSRECATLQSRLTAQLSLTQQLEAKLSQIAPVESPQELELLKSAKSNMEAQMSTLTSEMETLRQGQSQLQDKLTEKERKEVEASKAYEAEIKGLEATISELKASASKHLSESDERTVSLQKSIQELSKIKADYEQKVSDLQSSLDKAQQVIKEREAHVSKLVEETERLSDQLASTVERPKAEGQEDNADMGAIQEVLNSNESWKNKYSSIVEEKDDLVQKHEQLLKSLKSEMESIKTQNDQVSRDLEAQRAKNNELREKNWKAMEALKEAELKLVNQSNTNQAAASSQVQEKFIEQQKQLLKRLLPHVRVPESSDPSVCMSIYEEEFKKAVSASKSEEAEFSSTISKLEERVSHYQSILSETENMLHELQSSVESEEGLWKDRLSEKETEIAELRREKVRLSEKNSAFDESINVVKQAEEMQVKLHELQEKLGSEEKEKKELLSRISALSSLESENAKLNEEISSLKSTNRSMGERIVKMDHIMSTGQEALQHEQRTVLVMRDQIQNLHKNTNEAHVENGMNGKALNGGDTVAEV